MHTLLLHYWNLPCVLIFLMKYKLYKMNLNFAGHDNSIMYEVESYNSVFVIYLGLIFNSCCCSVSLVFVNVNELVRLPQF